MSVEVTHEIQIACAAMLHQGITFYVTAEREQQCGCVIMQGWSTDTVEPGLRFRCCGNPEHEGAYLRACTLWGTEVLNRRFPTGEPIAVMETIYREALGGVVRV